MGEARGSDGWATLGDRSTPSSFESTYILSGDIFTATFLLTLSFNSNTSNTKWPIYAFIPGVNIHPTFISFLIRPPPTITATTPPPPPPTTTTTKIHHHHQQQQQQQTLVWCFNCPFTIVPTQKHVEGRKLDPVTTIKVFSIQEHSSDVIQPTTKKTLNLKTNPKCSSFLTNNLKPRLPALLDLAK